MPKLHREDGVELHWDEEGEGPLVVLVPYATFHPSVYDPLVAELASDHRVVRYDDRGAGGSTRTGPYGLDTAAGDLEALLDSLGPAVLTGLGDAPNRAVRVAARRPELVDAIVVAGGLPIGRQALAGAEAMASSDTVVDAFLSMIETDYRGALRSLISAGNPQMSEDEIRDRVRAQAEYQDQEAALARLRAWIDDDPLEQSRACGERLFLLYSEDMGGGWFPAGREIRALARKFLPEAHVEAVEDGMVSRPDLTAAVVRRVTAPAEATSR
jgi:pimeloyl-ACP methyl ester carboxylesterase